LATDDQTDPRLFQADSISLGQQKVNPDGTVAFNLITAPLDLAYGSLGGPIVLHFDKAQGIPDSRGLIDFGPNFPGKNPDAGTISYQKFSTGLDIVGAGTGSGNRYARVWDNLVICQDNFSGGSIDVHGTIAQLRLFQRDSPWTNAQIIYNPSGFSGAIIGFFDSTGSALGDYLYFNARSGQAGVFDTWGEMACGQTPTTNGRGRVGVSSSAAGAAYLGGGGIFNNPGGWQRENANGQSMYYVSGATAQVYNILAGGGGTLNLVCSFPGGGGFAVDANGSVHGLAFPASSDKRFKKNVKTITPAEGLDLINSLRPVRFNWNSKIQKLGRVHSGEAKRTRIGFIAQEVEEILPELVETWEHHDPINEIHTEEEYKGIEYGRLVSVLVAAVQELTDRVKTLEGRGNG